MNIREKLVELLDEARAKRREICYVHSDCNSCVFGEEGENCGDKMIADHLIANNVTVQDATDICVGCKWIPVTERLPENFVSVLGYMIDTGPFPPVRECYTVGNAFYFPVLRDIHPVSHWAEMPAPPKGEENE